MIEELKEFGLSDNEITVYTTLLKTGTTTANRLAAISGMKRTTVYDTLNALILKGIVSTFTKDDVRNFKASDPKKIIDLLEEKKKRIERVIPELQNMREIIKEKNGVTYFEGKKGVITVLNDILDQKPKDLVFIGSRKMAKIPLKHYPENFVRKRVEKNIPITGILAYEDKQDKFLQESGAESISDFVYKKEINATLSDIFIYGDKVAFITNIEDTAGVIIKNKEIAKMMKLIFSLLK